MYLKRFILVILIMLWGVSFVQIFSVPPYAGDVYPVYKSGYFVELERQMGVIADSFLSIKTMSRAAYGWIFLDDMGTHHDIRVRVYDSDGLLVPLPGEKKDAPDEKVLGILHSAHPRPSFFIEGGRYHGIIPFIKQDRCAFCHNNNASNDVIGILAFSREYDGHVYYSSERVLIFILITLGITGLVFIAGRWQPGIKVKELFDKYD